MPFDERIQYLLLGGTIGFVLGYFTCCLRNIKEELDEVKSEIEHEFTLHKRGEGGFMRFPVAADLAMLLVVCITAWASFVSQKASNDAHNTQDRFEQIVVCNQRTIANLLSALDERSTYTVASADANIDLQSAQREFTKVVLHKPPFSDARKTRAFKNYFDQLNRFLRIAHKNKGKVVAHPLPTIDGFTKCLRQ